MAKLLGIFKNKFNNDYYWTHDLKDYDKEAYWSNGGPMFHSNGDGIFWDCRADEVYKKPIYYVDECNRAGIHECRNSIFVADIDGEGDNVLDYVDELQNEYELIDNELYVVLYYKYKTNYGLIDLVDFGITKQEIIDNVKAQKYVEGATYFTMKQVFR